MTLKASVKWQIWSNGCTILHCAPEDQWCSAVAVSSAAGLGQGSQAGPPFRLALFDWGQSGNGYWEKDGWWAELCSPCLLRLLAQRWAADVATSGLGAGACSSTATAVQHRNCWLWAEILCKWYSPYSPISSIFPVEGARQLLPSSLANWLLKMRQFCCGFTSVRLEKRRNMGFTYTFYL